jgi:putative heme transporter
VTDQAEGAPGETLEDEPRDAEQRDAEHRDAEHRDAEQQDAEHHEGVAQRLAHQWQAIRRMDRHPEPEPIVTGRSNFTHAEVPYGVDLAAAWSWRFLVIAAAAVIFGYVVAFLSVVVIPIVVAVLITALVIPLVDWLDDHGLPRGLAALLVVVTTIGAIVALLSFAGQQVAEGANDLADSVVAGLEEIEDWLNNGPLNLSDSQINDYITSIQEAIASRSESGEFLSQVTEVGVAVGHVVAGFFIVLFSTYFFLADGERIWAWLVRLAPRAARGKADSSGRVAWISLTQFVRATVIVAAVDATGVMLGAAILQVPFVLAIGVLVFLGAFVPLIGATIAGSVAVLVALVDQGPITALLMLGVIILVQQLEGHILQPFLMGRWVSLHPLGVIVAIAVGVLTAGIAGALVAVPLAAALNAVVQHLAANTDPGDDPVVELEEDYIETGATVEVPEPDGGGDGAVGG